MTADRWDRLCDLFHRALALEPSTREAFVAQHAGDAELLRELLSLLRTHPHAEMAGFLETSPAAADLSDPSPRLAAGDRLGPFEIVGLVGAGGMGEVYRARDTRLDRTVAIKVLSPALAADPVGHERFGLEARAVSKLSHPHICTLLDVGSATVGGDEVRYLVMEFVEGETLAARLGRGPLPLATAITCGIEIVEAIAAAHTAGVVHRDLKPANIVLTKSGVKLLDFGLARLRSTESVGHPAESANPLTGDGIIVGTIPYLSPEQLKGKDVDARTDIFAFGAVLYEMVAGSRAFQADSQAELVAAILERQPPPLAARQPLTPPALNHLVATCLAKDPDDRWHSAHDIGLRLREIRQGSSNASSPWASAAVAPHHPGAATRWRVPAAWAAVALMLAVAWWVVPTNATVSAIPPNPVPVVFLMDSPLEGRVYDPRTLAAGGTNADDISDALGTLKIAIHKENTSPMWHREEQVRQQRPDLVVSHLSCFADLRGAPPGTDLNEALFNVAQSRLALFFAYQAATNPRVRFLVYSRGRWPTKKDEAAWIAGVEARFPLLKGRLFTMLVPGGSHATFREPATAAMLLARVEHILRLQ